MSTDYKSPAFKKLLDSLQQQSWELELLISGFAIFGLLTAYDPIRINMIQAENAGMLYRFFSLLFLLVACMILLFNLLLHVTLRGLWIGALGLRYVSGDIEFEELRYSQRFIKYLKKRIPSFDKYIANMENYCSILFAVSFLLIFYVLSFSLIMIYFALVGNFIIENDALPNWVQKGIGIPLILFLAVGMLLTFIDFIGVGILKRNKYVAAVYFPFYWAFGFLTLSFLYRPLLYNFLDNRFGKRLLLMLTPAYLLISFLTSLSHYNSNYFDADNNSSSLFANRKNYLDQLTEKEDFPDNGAIGTKVVTTPFIHVFVPFNQNTEDQVFKYNDSLRPDEDIRGLRSGIQFNNSGRRRVRGKYSKNEMTKAYMKTVNEMYSFKIDSVPFDSELIFSEIKKNLLGFETYLPLDSLSEGKHDFLIIRKRTLKDSVKASLHAKIPFWYFPQSNSSSPDGMAN